MLPRLLLPRLRQRLRSSPVVALLGPRQAGKTTLAREVAAESSRPGLYLDLERPSDRHKLDEPELYLAQQTDRLVILDEVQRTPELFPVLRGLVDDRIRDQGRSAWFLVLGSASRELLQQSSESLAGRIAYLELTPFLLAEIMDEWRAPPQDRLWLRGGFPPSFLARDEEQSFAWRRDFVATYLERDLPQLGLRLPAEQVGRFWSMLAHGQGNQLNAARLAAGLGVSGNTVRSWLDLLTDLFLVRQLPAWSGSSQKRLVKAPKVYVRDSGIVHQLAAIPDLETLLGHPLCGPSWEGFVIENLLALLPDTWRASYYRTGAQAEIDLVLEGPRREVLAIEIKRSLTPALGKGHRLAFADVGARRGFFVMPRGERHPLAKGIEAIGLLELVALLRREWGG